MFQGLASYASEQSSSIGRVYPDYSSNFRNEFQRDRDRIVHSAAFRRLEYKTQVFVNHEGDMFRTRLTHSIEVAQIGRTTARELKVNEDLTEAICLAHDLGHTPFGHAGQDALNECMRNYGGFEHNLQSLRIVDHLEQRYAAFPGLNLMFETREGILKHCSKKNAEMLGDIGKRFINKQKPNLEAQIANIADEIAYNNHDVDDGLRAGLLTIEQLRECELVEENYQRVITRWGELDDRFMRHEIIRRMINMLVSDLVNTSQQNIERLHLDSVDDVRNCNEKIISMSQSIFEKHLALKKFLRKYLYQHERVQAMTDKAKQTIVFLFDAYMNDTSLLNEESQQLIEESDVEEGFLHSAGYSRLHSRNDRSFLPLLSRKGFREYKYVASRFILQNRKYHIDKSLYYICWNIVII